MRAIIGMAVFVVTSAVGFALIGDATSGATWGRMVAVLAAAAVAWLSTRLVLGRRAGRGDGTCLECRGEGLAFYGSGRTTYRRRCRVCRGSGSAPGERGNPRIPEALLHPGERTDGATVPVTAQRQRGVSLPVLRVASAPVAERAHGPPEVRWLLGQQPPQVAGP